MSAGRRPILLIAYKFPPYARRRRVSVGQAVEVPRSSWPRDPRGQRPLAGVRSEHAHGRRRGARSDRSRIPSGSPHRFRHRPCAVAGGWGALCRATWARRRLFYDDEAQRWGRHLVGFCERLIDERGIEVAVATGHPFQANRWAAELKRRRPGAEADPGLPRPVGRQPVPSLSRRRAAAHSRLATRRGRRGGRRGVGDAWPARAVYARCPRQARRGDHERRRPRERSSRRSRAALADGSHPAHAHRQRLNGRDRPLDVLLDAVRGLRPGGPEIEVELVGAMLGFAGPCPPRPGGGRRPAAS